jgi:hypothetical protein
VVSDAPLPTRPARPKPLVNGVIGGIVALFIAVAGALVIERSESIRNGSFHDRAGVAPASGVERAGSVEPSRPKAIAAGFFDRS